MAGRVEKFYAGNLLARVCQSEERARRYFNSVNFIAVNSKGFLIAAGETNLDAALYLIPVPFTFTKIRGSVITHCTGICASHLPLAMSAAAQRY